MFVDLSLRVDPENHHALREHLSTALVLGELQLKKKIKKNPVFNPHN